MTGFHSVYDDASSATGSFTWLYLFLSGLLWLIVSHFRSEITSLKAKSQQLAGKVTKLETALDTLGNQAGPASTDLVATQIADLIRADHSLDPQSVDELQRRLQNLESKVSRIGSVEAAIKGLCDRIGSVEAAQLKAAAAQLQLLGQISQFEEAAADMDLDRTAFQAHLSQLTLKLDLVDGSIHQLDDQVSALESGQMTGSGALVLAGESGKQALVQAVASHIADPASPWQKQAAQFEARCSILDSRVAAMETALKSLGPQPSATDLTVRSILKPETLLSGNLTQNVGTDLIMGFLGALARKPAQSDIAKPSTSATPSRAPIKHQEPAETFVVPATSQPSLSPAAILPVVAEDRAPVLAATPSDPVEQSNAATLPPQQAQDLAPVVADTHAEAPDSADNASLPQEASVPVLSLEAEPNGNHAAESQPPTDIEDQDAPADDELQVDMAFDESQLELESQSVDGTEAPAGSDCPEPDCSFSDLSVDLSVLGEGRVEDEAIELAPVDDRIRRGSGLFVESDSVAAVGDMETNEIRADELSQLGGPEQHRQESQRHQDRWDQIDEDDQSDVPQEEPVDPESLAIILEKAKCASLEDLSQKTSISLARCKTLRSISVLSRCHNLRSINLTGCESLRSIEALRPCTQLSDVDLSDCKALCSVEPLKSLTGLSSIALYGLSSHQIPDLDSTLHHLVRSNDNLSEFKYLGATFDVNGLQMDRQIQRMTATAQVVAQRIAKQGYTLGNMTARSLVRVYKTFVRPTMEYALSLDLLEAKQAKTLNRTQMHCLTALFKVVRSTSWGAIREGGM
ncbi:uncharacterized protein BJ171DRAFT_599420 [Polychytrium aggregatum]|uniref:uncharacterized protein n=1 Tax=Polychytrium aggregatum TaxID=110093 RepID=UPI0022FDB771|nr:uncharacterized protein BJ171DRAFT_599420 [Polychytrium aggregatum]KAI9204253.1 hypothetical protein BJ171DRAFT_599420 [Polychytrium aggregatum]